MKHRRKHEDDEVETERERKKNTTNTHNKTKYTTKNWTLIMLKFWMFSIPYMLRSFQIVFLFISTIFTLYSWKFSMCLCTHCKPKWNWRKKSYFYTHSWNHNFDSKRNEESILGCKKNWCVYFSFFDVMCVCVFRCKKIN